MDILKEQIQNLQQKIRYNIDNLNCGGCCYFAYYFSERLKKLNIPHSIYFEDYLFLERTLKNFITPSHVFIFIEGIGFIDGYKTLSQKEKDKTYVKIRYQLKKALDKGSWNNYYKTKQNRLLKKLIYENIK